MVGQSLDGLRAVALYLSVTLLPFCIAAVGYIDFVLKELGSFAPVQRDKTNDKEDHEPPDALLKPHDRATKAMVAREITENDAGSPQMETIRRDQTGHSEGREGGPLDALTSVFSPTLGPARKSDSSDLSDRSSFPSPLDQQTPPTPASSIDREPVAVLEEHAIYQTKDAATGAGQQIAGSKGECATQDLLEVETDVSMIKFAPLVASLELTLTEPSAPAAAAQRDTEEITEAAVLSDAAMQKRHEFSTHTPQSAVSLSHIPLKHVEIVVCGHTNTPAQTREPALSGTATTNTAPRVTSTNLFDYSCTLQSPKAAIVTLQRQLDVIAMAGHCRGKGVLPQHPPRYGRDWVDAREELELIQDQIDRAYFW